MTIEMRLKMKNKSYRYDMNRARPRHRHKYIKYKTYLSILMVVLTPKEHLKLNL